jgi:predicted RNA-binding Zn-ribbon protein involved in translation (DUF1610 family)
MKKQAPTQKFEMPEKCSCGQHLTPSNVEWLGEMKTSKHTLELYNCPACGTTKCVKIKSEEKRAA